jgi:hypothetical protein
MYSERFDFHHSIRTSCRMTPRWARRSYPVPTAERSRYTEAWDRCRHRSTCNPVGRKTGKKYPGPFARFGFEHCPGKQCQRKHCQRKDYQSWDLLPTLVLGPDFRRRHLPARYSRLSASLSRISPKVSRRSFDFRRDPKVRRSTRCHHDYATSNDIR